MLNIDLRESLMMLPALLFGFSIHECAHACTAKHFGDSTAEREGRISLNPFVHIDPVGFFLFFIGGFGWAKPVPVNLFNFKNRKRADLLISLAGPFANIMTLTAFAILVKLIYIFYPSLFELPEYGDIIYDILTYFIWVNITMAVFNLLPIPPLDGSHILFDLLPDRFDTYHEKFSQLGAMLLFGLIMFDVLPVGNITKLIYGSICSVLGI